MSPKQRLGKSSNFIRSIVRTDLGDGLDMKTYMEWYTGIHNRSTNHRDRKANFDAQLLMYKEVDEAFRGLLEDVRERSQACSKEILVGHLGKEWEQFRHHATYLNHCFRYLNRHGIRYAQDEGRIDVHIVYDLCMLRWKEVVFENLRERAINAVLDEISKQRNGEYGASSVLRRFFDSIMDLSWEDLRDTQISQGQGIILHREVLDAILQATYELLQKESALLLSETSTAKYLEITEARLLGEQGHVPLYLLDGILAPMITACEKAFINDHLDIICDEFQERLELRDDVMLSRIYRLLARLPGGLDRLHHPFGDYVQSSGLAAMENAPHEENKLDSKAYVSTLLACIMPMKDLLSKAFNDDIEFGRFFETACRKVVNENKFCQNGSHLSAEMVAEYINIILSSTQSGINEVDSELQKIMTLLEYIIDKDVFERSFSRHFAKHLLRSSASSESVDRIVISKFLNMYGGTFAARLQRMLQDKSRSHELSLSFKNWQSPSEETSQGQTVDTSFHVLHQGSWPLSLGDTSFVPPVEVSEMCERFTGFYDSQHKGRKLTWLWDLCRGELQANCFMQSSQKPCIFQTSTHQMAILLLFNSSDQLPYRDIVAATKLPQETLDPSLDKLVKSRVLSRQTVPDTGDVKFSINYGFKSNKVKNNLIVTIKSKKRKEIECGRKADMEHRRMQTQCAIVRIMKARKKSSFTELIFEAKKQLATQFELSTSAAKSSIDILVDKEFLRRLSDDCIEYLA